MSNSKSNSATPRYRNFACVVYPESAPDNWKELLKESKVPIFISPLHDKDINPTGEPKKPHYHVMAMYDGKKSVEQVSEFFKTFGGVGCEVVSSSRAYARYLCHLDNPEKAQYKTTDVLSVGGANYRVLIGTMADKNLALGEMIDYINETDIDSFYELVCYAKEFKTEWFDCLINSGSYFIKEFIKSRAWKLHKYEEKQRPQGDALRPCWAVVEQQIGRKPQRARSALRYCFLSLMEVVFIRFCITPVNLRFKPTKIMIVTDDYSDSEIGQKRHLRHIKEDINNTPDWNSKFAYIYNANNLNFLERISLTN